MSLMNDALRKKNRENLVAGPLIDVPAPPKKQRRARKSTLFLGALAFFVGAVVGSMVLFAPQDNERPMTRQPLAKPAGIPSAVSTDQARVKGMPEGSASASPPVNGQDPLLPSKAIDAAVNQEQAKPLSRPAVSDGLPPRQSSDPAPSRAANAVPTPMEKTAADEKRPIPLEGNRPSPAENRHPPANVVEPGPDRPDASPRKRPQSAAIRKAKAKPLSPESPNAAKSAQGSTLSDTALFYQKALACHRSGRLDEAVRFYQSVLEVDPNHKEAMLNLAAVYIDEGRFSQAAPLLEGLEKHPPHPKGMLLNLAITALGKHEPESALDYLERAKKAADAPVWQIQFHRAVALAHLNRLSEAIVLYETVEAERPDDYRVKFNLAVTHDALEDYPQAIYYYETVLKAPGQALPKDRQSIHERVGLLRRYLNTTQSSAIRQ